MNEGGNPFQEISVFWKLPTIHSSSGLNITRLQELVQPIPGLTKVKTSKIFPSCRWEWGDKI